MRKDFYIYILASQRNGTLYIGVTSNLLQRIHQHKHSSSNKCFTARHKVNQLVYYEQHFSAESAIHREKRLKLWKRKWKIDLIETINPDWRDLYWDIGEDWILRSSRRMSSFKKKNLIDSMMCFARRQIKKFENHERKNHFSDRNKAEE